MQHNLCKVMHNLCKFMYLGLAVYFYGQKSSSRVLPGLHPLANSAMMRTQTMQCQWKDKARERTGYPTSYVSIRKMKSLTLHIKCCMRTSFSQGLIFFIRKS